MTSSTSSAWVVDPNHSVVQFKVKHLAISTISGKFTRFNGRIQTHKEDFSDATVQFELETASINTDQAERDEHLKSPLFFNSEQFPMIRFTGSFEQQDDNEYQLTGELTMLETTRKITLKAELTGTGTGRFGDIRAGFEIRGKLNRKDYGLDFGLLTATGNLVVGEEIKLHIDLQVIKE